MNLTHPAALYWLVLAVPVVVCYVLRVRLRRVDVSTHLFWSEVFPDRRRQALWGRLQHLGSLLVQLLLLALLVFALADPVPHGTAAAARRMVLVLDHSASMKARDGAGTRLESARKEARRVLAGLRFHDEAALVTCGASVRVACGMTGHRRALEKALDAVTPDDGPGNVPAALVLGRRLLAGATGQQVLVISDGCFDGAAAVAAAPDVRWLQVGSRTANAGIRQFQARRSLRDPTMYEVLVEVVNASDEPLECQLTLERDDSLVDVVRLQVEANEVWRHVSEHTSAEGGTLTVHLDHKDASSVDDRAYAVLPPRQESAVHLVSPGSLFLEKVLEANPLVRQPFTVGRTPNGTTPKAEEGPAVVIYHERLPARLPAGPILVIHPLTSCDLFEVGERLAEAAAAEQDPDAPLLTNVHLVGLTLPRARRLLPLREQAHVLVKAVGGEPLCIAFQRPQGRVLVLTGDLETGELPLRTAFPILMTNALVWLAGGQENFREAVATGSVVEVPLPDKAPELQLIAPDGRLFPLPAGTPRASLGPLDQVGVWRVAAGRESAPVIEVACNLANGRRSDLRPDAPVVAANRPLEPGPFLRPLWFYLLGLCAALLVIEWGLYQRRKIR
jgi:von Willebrand factor type A domain/Aerotolerance regulator N-terminal